LQLGGLAGGGGPPANVTYWRWTVTTSMASADGYALKSPVSQISQWHESSRIQIVFASTITKKKLVRIPSTGVTQDRDLLRGTGESTFGPGKQPAGFTRYRHVPESHILNFVSLMIPGETPS
jgi:hypothetical protein